MAWKRVVEFRHLKASRKKGLKQAQTLIIAKKGYGGARFSLLIGFVVVVDLD